MELNQDNYEKFLLLYIDNELTAPERAAVEAFLESNPPYAHEFKVLRNAILTPEVITYDDKSMLYRFEEMNATIDPSFKKSLYKQTNSTGKLIEFKKRYIAYASIAAVALWMLIGTKQVFKTNSQASTTIVEQALTSTQEAINKKNKLSLVPNTFVAVATKPKKGIVNQPINFSKVTVQNEISNPTNTVNIDPETIASKQETVTKEVTPTVNESQANNNSFVAASKLEKEIFEEINTEDNDRVLYISNIELDGDKFRGITRKLGAIFRRNKIEKNK